MDAKPSFEKQAFLFIRIAILIARGALRHHDLQLLRVLVTGVAGGPHLFDMLALMDKQEVVRRLEAAVAKF